MKPEASFAERVTRQFVGAVRRILARQAEDEARTIEQLTGPWGRA